jgi:two-component system, NarL family, response regulator NreC
MSHAAAASTASTTDLIRVLIADDHTLFRQGVRRLLEDSHSVSVVGEAEDGLDATRQAASLQPDVILMDISMPKMNGIEATRQILSERPEARVLILTMHDNERYIGQILRAGAAGYLLKDTPSAEFLSAIQAVHRGDSYLSPAVSRRILDGLMKEDGGQETRTRLESLTPREREVLTLLAEGKSNREVARLLTISPKTVDVHRTHIMKKLDIHSIVQLVKYAIQQGVVEI